MARFRFRLETLLKVREDERRQRRAELAEAYEADRVLQIQIDGVTAELSAARRKTREAAAPGTLNVDGLLDLERYAVQLKAQGQLVRQRQSRVREEIERRRLILVEADRQVRALEKLRDKQREAFVLEAQRQEQKNLDEVAGRVESRE